MVEQGIAQDVAPFDDGPEALQQVRRADGDHLALHQQSRIELRPVAVAVQNAHVITFVPVIEAAQVVHDLQLDFRVEPRIFLELG
ncbi:hypothetical protein D9M72_415750 [compost metagenome]